MPLKPIVQRFLEKLSGNEKKLFYGTVWNFFGNGFGKLVLLLSSVLVARFLGPEIFGKWGVIRSTSAVFTILLGFGVGVTAIKYVAELKDSDKVKAGNILGIAISFAVGFGLFLTLIFYSLSEFISIDILRDESLLVPLRISSLFLVIIAINGVLSGSLAGFNNFKYIAVSNLFGGVLSTPLILFLCKYYGLNGLVVGYVLYYLITLIFLYVFFRKSLEQNLIVLSLKNYRENSSVILHHNVPAILSGGIGGFVIWIVNAYVARLNFGFTILGINNAAKIIQNSIMELSAQLDVPMISYLSSTIDSKRKDKLNFFSPIVIVTALVFPLIIFPELITWMFADAKYDQDNFSLVVALTMVTTFIMVYKRGLGRIIITKSKLWLGVYENLLWSVLILVFIVTLVPDLGAVGFAMAFAFSYLIDVLVITPYYFYKKLIPSEITYSKEILVWFFISISVVFLIVFEVPLFYRSLIFLVVFPFQLFLVRKIGRMFSEIQ